LTSRPGSPGPVGPSTVEVRRQRTEIGRRFAIDLLTADRASSAEPSVAERAKEVGVEFAADLVQPDPVRAASEHAAQLLNTPMWTAVDAVLPPGDCTMLAALADILDSVQAMVRSAIAGTVQWCAELLEMPPILAEFAGEVVSRAVGLGFLDPLHWAAQTTRVAGVMYCAGDNCLGSCACVRALAKQVTERALADRLTAVGRELAAAGRV
jgi:hypothetical protein